MLFGDDFISDSKNVFGVNKYRIVEMWGDTDMTKPRIIIVDEDESYAMTLQAKFIYEFLDNIELEVITDQKIIDKTFATAQKADILIIDSNIHSETIQKQEIDHVFVMTESKQSASDDYESEYIIFKYANIKSIFMEIVGKSSLTIPNKKRELKSKVILVTSGSGGVGKTTVALGLASALSSMYKRVLYMEAAKLQNFSYFLEDKTPIDNAYIYDKLSKADRSIYQDIKAELRTQIFNYIPPFKTALLSFGIDYSVFRKIAESAKESNDYDYIIIDADSCFDEEKTRLISLADHVLIITEQSEQQVYNTNMLMNNINNNMSDKYLFICNKYDSHKDGYERTEGITYKIDEYVDKMEEYSRMKFEDLGQQDGIKKVAFLMI